MSDPSTDFPSQLPSTSEPAPRDSAPRNSIFRGPNGIRAGWRVATFIVLAALIAIVLVVFAGLLSRGRRPQVSQLTPLGTILSEALIFLSTAAAALIMARIEHRKFGEYGLPGRSMFGNHFWIGGVAGFASISACLLGIFAFRGFHLTGLAIHGNTLVRATVAWSIAFVTVGLAEEFSFRGYLQYTLTTGMGFWPSAFVLSALFGAAHAGNPGESKAGLVSVVMFGLLFCLFLRRTGNLWWAVGFHAGWDWGQTFFYGVPDSGMAPYHNLFNCAFTGPRWLTGGTVGPEASIFTPIVLLIVAVAFNLVYPQDRYRTVEARAS